jgi:hypothetical protein
LFALPVDRRSIASFPDFELPFTVVVPFVLLVNVDSPILMMLFESVKIIIMLI